MSEAVQIPVRYRRLFMVFPGRSALASRSRSCADPYARTRPNAEGLVTTQTSGTSRAVRAQTLRATQAGAQESGRATSLSRRWPFEGRGEANGVELRAWTVLPPRAAGAY